MGFLGGAMSNVKGTPTYSQVAVGTAPTVIRGPGVNGQRKQLIIYNNGAVTLYIGTDANVNGSTGFPIPAGTSRELLWDNGQWYGIAASGTLDVRIIEVV